VTANPGSTPAAGVGVELSKQEKYDAALLDALNHLAERKYPEAMTSLEAARTLQDTDEVRALIKRLTQRMEQQAAAKQTVQDIQTILREGKPEEAAPLANAALQQYGGSDNAARLSDLKLQADTLAAAQVDDQARFDRCRRDGEAALRDRNFRAAAVAFEQALAARDDAEVRRQYDDLRATLARYDDNRRRAAELRRDPSQLEAALAALQEAEKAWDTPEIRQDLDDYGLALAKRRDRISVADFEVRGDVGLPAPGRAVAEELLPCFKPRFDLVERSQVGKVLAELNLEAGRLADNEAGRFEVGRLARLRYLVVGSITCVGGITVQARLVDVQTGLVVQTAKVVAANPDEMMALLPRLANLLQMSDEQKMAYEQQLAREAAVAVSRIRIAPLPPPPEVVVGPLPPPLLICTARPPDFGSVRPADFEALPLVVATAPPPPPVVFVEEEPVKRRFLQVAIELGDNLFRRGRYREAQTHFELALNLAPGRAEVGLRIERCRPLAAAPPPPPPPIVSPVVPIVTPPPAVVLVPARPRVAVFSFLLNADPGLAPPGLGDWAADQIACYFSPTYDVIDRGELFWWMGRLGLTVRDVLTDPCARAWLGRALQVRFFVFGVVEQTHSFNVSTHLVEAETGQRHGTGTIHVQDHAELKLRMHELVRQTLGNPADAARMQAEAKASEERVNEARRLLQAGQPARAAEVCRTGLKQDSSHVGLKALLSKAEQQDRQVSARSALLAPPLAHEAQAQAARRQELARQAETARARIDHAGGSRTETDRRAQEAQHQRAAEQLLAQGRRALDQQRYAEAAQLFANANALKPSDEATHSLATAKARAREAEQARAAAEQQRARADQERLKAEALARARADLDRERARTAAEAETRRQSDEARDQAAYTKLLGDGQRLLAQGKFDAAVSALQSARQIRKTDEVERLLHDALDKQARARAPARPQPAPADRAAAEAEKRRSEEEQKRAADVQRLLKQGRAALQARQFDTAATALAEARRLAPTDPDVARALNDLDRERNAAAAEARARQQQQERKRSEFNRFLSQAQSAMAARRYDEAIRAYNEALGLQPGDPAATRGLREATQARDAARPRPPSPPPSRPEPPKPPKPPAPAGGRAEYDRQMQQGAALEKQQRYADAARAYQEALRLLPGDAKAAAALRSAQFSSHMAEGQKAMNARRYPDAVREYEEALKISPGNAAAAAALKQAREARR
jgi:tetratricopeptide (TPR) repeat protein